MNTIPEYIYNGPFAQGNICTFVSESTEKLKIYNITSIDGPPGVMLIYVNNVPKASFTFSDPYIGLNFEFTDKSGKIYTGKVVDGKINLV